jgi:hypothetical protein
MGDGHYIPTYSPSLVTPTPTAGDGLPLNSRGKGAGACDYCHDQDSLATPVIRNNQDLHHGKGFDCTWCHNVHSVAAIRQCEGCHGPGSLHKIQADSPATGNIGTIVVGAELAGYGHIGRDVEPGDSDCWGCHGFAMAAAPDFGPVIPTVRGMNKSTFTAGAATSVVVTGAGFTNTSNVGVAYESTVTLTAANGASVNLTPDVFLDQGSLVVTIPPTIRPGNYLLRASKTGLASNSVRLCVIPKVRITSAAAAPDRTVTINGSGFAGYQKGSGTKVVGMTSTGRMFYGTVVAWSPGKIVARFGTVPAKIKVFSVFGTATRAVTVP